MFNNLLSSLAPAMHAGVRAACAHHLDGAHGELRERRLQHILHRPAAGLALPSLVRGTEVRNAKGDPLDRPCFRGCRRSAHNPTDLLRHQPKVSSMAWALAFKAASEALSTTSCRSSRAPSTSPI